MPQGSSAVRPTNSLYLYLLPLLTVQWINSWWWTEELSETCRVSCQNKFMKLEHVVGLIIKKLRSYLWYLESPLTFEHISPCFQITGPLAWTSLLDSSTRKGCGTLGWQCIIPGGPNFVRGPLIFVDPRCRNCFTSPSWYLEFWKIFSPHLYDVIDHAEP